MRRESPVSVIRSRGRTGTRLARAARMSCKTVTTALLALACTLALAPSPLRAQSQLALSADDEAGLDALQRGDAAKAAALFRAAIVDDDRDPIARYGAGAAAHLLGRDDEARSHLIDALEIAPRFSGASVLLGEIAYQQGDLAFAIRTYEQALAFAPRNAALQDRLATWRSEADRPRRTDGPYTILFEGAAQERLAAHATAVLDTAYWHVANTLGIYPSTPITVVFYSDRAFHDITGVPEWADGSFDTRIRIPVRGALGDRVAFDRVLIHELVHAMIASVAATGVPAWLHEGLAMRLEPDDASAAERRMRAGRVFVPLANLQERFSHLSQRQALAAYDESVIAADVLVRRLGNQTGILLQDLASGTEVSDAVERFGFSYRDFEGEVAGRVEARSARRGP
jgi:hypothetical protein